MSASSSKYRPRVSAVGLVDHPRLDLLVERAAPRSLVTVTAGPGRGKTTFACQWAQATGASWCSFDAGDVDPIVLATSLTAAVGIPGEVESSTDDPRCLAQHVVDRWRSLGAVRLVLDDADRAIGTPSHELLRHLRALAGRQLQLLVVSRRDLGLASPRDRVSGEVLELDASHLALDTERVARLLELELASDASLAARIVDATHGWPAAVRLLVEALHDIPAEQRSAWVPELTGPAGPVRDYIASELLPDLGEPLTRILIQLSLAGDVDAAHLAGSAEAGSDPNALTAQLVASGLARVDPGQELPGQVLAVAPVVRRVLVERVLPLRDDADALVDRVVDRLVQDGELERGLAVLTRAGRITAVSEMLERHGDTLVHAGALDTVDEAAAALPDRRRSDQVELVHGQALAYRGEWSAALACLSAAGLEDEGPLSTRHALIAGMVHHLRGQLDTAIATYGRGPDADGAGPDHAALLAWRSTAHWLRGDADDARRCAEAAMTEAVTCVDDRALGLAHTAAAMVAASDGDRHANQVHYDHALAAARRAGDRLQQARILTNRGSRYLENGEYELALSETDEAIDLAEQQGFAMIVGVARCNRAEILLRTGRLDEAIADAERAQATFARIGSSNESYAHHLLGDARREQGELVLARLAYQRALQLATPSGDRQGRVPAYVGLARTLVGSDPDAAAEAVDRAAALDDGLAVVVVVLAGAWVALARGDRETARTTALEARAEATRREDRSGVAEAMTLLSLLDDDPVPGLQEAASLWWQVGARISATRAELGVAQRSRDASARDEARTLEARLIGWGCSADGGAYAHRAVAGVDLRSSVAIRALGTFAVERDGRPVPRSAWGSRKARELLKVLVVSGGRRVPREELADLLWPGEAYEDVANRLSVALSVVRGVLAGADADREGTALRADTAAVGLDLDAIDVDVQRFRRLAEEGVARARSSDREAALERLLAAEEAYGGDLLEDDRDVLWLVDRREELRSLYVTVARTAADLLLEDDPDRAMRLLLRVLDRDGYDEPAHLGVCRALRRSGRHGEARRRHRLYEGRMAELDLPAVPLHDV